MRKKIKSVSRKSVCLFGLAGDVRESHTYKTSSFCRIEIVGVEIPTTFLPQFQGCN